ncbi:MAG: ATP-dependent helicase RhlE [Miltoncostaeaceae bacterium]|jgi:superfamily II DNA/RNA helicase|nr:ATP-dependent helicase RhlE [Miltoncostaeaceae bacterium]
MPEQSFADLGVSAPVVAALAASGVHAPFPIQSLVIPDVLAGRDVLAQSPTGSGKTLAFALPLIERLGEPRDGGPRALVLVPTRELAGQVAAETALAGAPKRLRVAAVYGGRPLARQAREAARADLVVATPGRLDDLLTRRLLELRGVQSLVLDEADRMLDMGFKPQVERILRRMPGPRQTLLFSATLEGEVARLAADYTRAPRRHVAAPDADRGGSIEHRFLPVATEDRVDALFTALAEERDLALVFVRTKHGADRLTRRLGAHGLASAALHGNKSQSARERALAGFGSGRLDTLVATDIAARGLDVDGISHVINFDPPADQDTYVHRIGRTGRAGRGGIGITFVAPQQEDDMRRMAAGLELGEAFARGGFRERGRRAPSGTRGAR